MLSLKLIQTYFFSIPLSDQGNNVLS